MNSDAMAGALTACGLDAGAGEPGSGGYFQIIECFPGTFNGEGGNEDATRIVSIDTSGGFLLQSIVAANGRFQITDTRRNRPLFSDFVEGDLFRDAASRNDDGAMNFAAVGADLCRLPREYLFRPGSDIVIQRVPNGDAVAPPELAPRVFLCGWRFDSPAVPAAAPEDFYVFRVPLSSDTGVLRRRVLVEGQRPFVLTQIATRATDDVEGQWRFQVRDVRLQRDIFTEGPAPSELFACPLGPRFALGAPHAFRPAQQIEVTAVPTDPEAGGELVVYLIGYYANA